MNLRTVRLRLEPLEARHAAEMFAGLQDPSIFAYIPDQPPQTISELANRYAGLATGWSPDRKERWFNWALRLTDESRYIGHVQATLHEDRSASIAYVLFCDARGKGYGIEAVETMMQHLFSQHRVSLFRASVDIRNAPSVALLESLGFSRVSLGREGDPDEAEYSRAAADAPGSALLLAREQG